MKEEEDFYEASDEEIRSEQEAEAAWLHQAEAQGEDDSRELDAQAREASFYNRCGDNPYA